MKKAIIVGGNSFNQKMLTINQGQFGKRFDEHIYLPQLHARDLAEFDCLFLASRPNPKLLRQNAQKLLDYVQSGRALVVLGGADEEFLPHIKYEEGEVNFWWWIHEGADLPLYAFDEGDDFWDFLRLTECKWHYHGHFHVPRECRRRIIINEIGQNILYKDEVHFAGPVYLTSLDPDFHIGQGFMPTTIPFFEKFISWVEHDLKKEKK